MKRGTAISVTVAFAAIITVLYFGKSIKSACDSYEFPSPPTSLTEWNGADTKTETRRTSPEITAQVTTAQPTTPPQTTPPPPVDCCSIKFDIEPLCNGTNRVVIGNCSCVDILLCRMVAVTSLSSNHFNEAHDYFGSLHLYYPRLKIVVYDLGLNENELRTLRTYCNVAEIRPFPFEKYPAHVRSLLLYSWKPLVVQEASKDFEVILYGDASVRMLSSDMSPAIRELIKFPFLSGSPHDKIVGLTHDGMINYLYSPPRTTMGTFTGTHGGVWIMWANSLMKRTVIPEWADCALHTECIAPEGGTQLYTCILSLRQYNDGRYVGCHRYDQSAISMILARDFGLDIEKHIAQYSISDKLWVVDRAATNTHPIKIC